MRLVGAVILASALPAGVNADPPGPLAYVTPACPFRAATPYNATVVGRPVPSPANTMPSFVLGCEFPNMNTDPYVYPPCAWGCGWGGGCNDCGGCGSLFGKFGGWGCGSCNTCDSGCGSLFDRFRGFGCGKSCGCESACNSCNACGSLFDRFRGFGCGKSCGCESACNSCNACGNGSCGGSAIPAPAPAPVAKPAVKAVGGVEPVGFWDKPKKKTANDRANECLNCPPNGPPPKHTSPHATTLGCSSCSTLASEYVFLFGSCKQFFGEPTHGWLHGKR